MRRRDVCVLLLNLATVILLGCGEKITTTREVKTSTPGGTTTITTKQEIKKTGDHPPPVNP